MSELEKESSYWKKVNSNIKVAFLESELLKKSNNIAK